MALQNESQTSNRKKINYRWEFTASTDEKIIDTELIESGSLQTSGITADTIIIEMSNDPDFVGWIQSLNKDNLNPLVGADGFVNLKDLEGVYFLRFRRVGSADGTHKFSFVASTT